MNYVTYEAFGAVGDGKTDDLPAIVRAHDYANENGLPVRADDAAAYYIGGRALTAVICTPTDFGKAHFIIDDTVTEDYRADIFSVPASGEAGTLPLKTLSRGQTHLDLSALGVVLTEDLYVTVENDAVRQYIRRGANQDTGSAQTDSFILTAKGEILSGINWDYGRISRVETVPIDRETLEIRGGFFTTVANQAESRYTYYGRGITVSRSNTVLRDMTHTVTGERDHGAPYSGFFGFRKCAYCQMKNCFVTGHKIYETIGSAGVPVSMGSYDINTFAVIGVTFDGCRQDDICNRTLWGVFGSNFCKQITFENCVLSRSDAHCGVRDYIIRNSVMGWMGTNTIGFGTMLLENVTCYCGNVIGFRSDYGCTWDGDLTLRNITWIPVPGSCVEPIMLYADNDGQHDFGYPCTLPHNITIENVTLVDTNTPDSYTGVRIFSDFDRSFGRIPEKYPLGRPDTLTIRGFRAVSGKAPVICDNMALLADTKITVEP